MRNTIVIVGAGFCGTVLAAILLRRPPAAATDIVLIERGAALGRGVAYAVREFPFLLNVPAARLSADARDPLQFLRFAQRSQPEADGEDFLPRELYGDYLQDVLEQAERAAPAHVRLVRVLSEVRNISRHEGAQPLAVEFADRAPLPANRVILALGNPPPPVLPWADEVRNHAAYRHDPWDLPETLAADQSILIVGNGLTMVDVALALTRDADRAPMLHTISRHGLLPQPQTTFRPCAVQGGEESLARAHSIREVLAATRKMAREVERSGGDWREVVTFVRHSAPGLWQRLAESEKRRFVRHLQCYWDVHRHRLPPQLGSRIELLLRSGRLQINAGRIQQVIPADHRLRVVWRPRGGGAAATLTVDALINATGSDYALRRTQDTLLKSLRSAGLICEDALNLGLRTGRYGACLDARGAPSEYLFYLGPMLRAAHWEATAALELRDHAEQLAAHLAAPRG